MKKKVISVLLTVSMLASVMTGCGKSEDSAKDSIYLGVAGPLTGDSAMYGETVKEGVEFAVKEINASGGIDGKEVKLVIEDDMGDPDEAVTVAQKLIENNKIFAVIGHVNSSCTLAALPVYNQTGMTVIGSSCSAETITQQGYKNFFRTVIHDGLVAPMMMKHATENLGDKKIACIVANSDYGLGLLDGAKGSAGEYGATIVASEEYVPLQDKDFSVQLAKIKKASPDCLFILGDYNEAGLIMRQMKSAGLEGVDVVMPSACSNDKTIELAGKDAAEGAYMLGYWDPDLDEDAVQSFVKNFEKETGHVPDERNAYGYEIPYIIKMAIEKGATKETLSDVLRTIEYEGPTGTTKFDENGDVTEKMQRVFIIKDGKFTSWVKE